jgi:putative transcriptional regulator
VCSVRRIAVAALALFASALVAPGHGGAADGARGFVAGQLLVASPAMGDPRFARTVICMLTHDGDGAMGLVVNRAFGQGPLSALLNGFGVDDVEPDLDEEPVRLHYGGPVERGRGFVLHSTDYRGPSTRPVGEGLAVSSGRDVLDAVAAGEGPAHRVFLLGYAGWGPGQLEGEMAREDWLTAPAEPSLVFARDLDAVWEAAMALAGLSL